MILKYRAFNLNKNKRKNKSITGNKVNEMTRQYEHTLINIRGGLHH